MRKKKNSILALSLAFLMLCTSFSPGTAVFAKSKNPKFVYLTSGKSVKKKKITLRKGKSVKIKVKNTSKKIKSLKSANKKIATVKRVSGKKNIFKVKAKKKGSTNITMKVGKKKMVLKVKVKKGSPGNRGNAYKKKKRESFERITLKTSLPNGLYRYSVNDEDIMNETIHANDFGPEMFYAYQGKIYRPFYCPNRNIEVSLARNSRWLSGFFSYYDQYYAQTGDNVIATLDAIKKYAMVNNFTYSTGSLDNPLFTHTGKCDQLSQAAQYLCYLTGVDAVTVSSEAANHQILVIKYGHNWYGVEATNLLSSQYDDVGIYGSTVACQFYDSQGQLTENSAKGIYWIKTCAAYVFNSSSKINGKVPTCVNTYPSVIMNTGEDIPTKLASGNPLPTLSQIYNSYDGNNTFYFKYDSRSRYYLFK